MKPLLLCSMLLGVAVAAHAQAPVGKRALTKVEIKSAEWSSYSRSDSRDYNHQVAALQLLLRNQGFFKTKVDGRFGPGTLRAVKNFQRKKGSIADGVVGSQTWGKLCPRLKRGDQGDAVRAFQTLLNYENVEGSALKVDGVFGFSTETALRKYQKSVEMFVDGIAGAQMWSYLLSPSPSD